MPDISGMFRFVGIQPKDAVAAMRFSDDQSVLTFLACYDDLCPISDLASVPLEAIVLKAGVNPNLLLSATMFAYKNVQASKSAMLAMKHHPKVLRSRIKFAQLPGGSRDRDALDTAVGFLPSPKGQSINLNFGRPETPAKREEGDSENPDVNELFPMITDVQENWQENRTKLLKGKV